MKYQPPHGEADPDKPYVNGDPSISRKGSILPAAAAEYPQREIVNFIENSDQVPTDGDLEQLTRGIRNQWVNFCVDTGSVNSLSVALVPALTAYKQGTPLRVLVQNNNTGPTTINVNALGNRPVKRSNGAQLQPDDMRVGMVALLVDDGTQFQMMNYLGVTSSVNNSYTIDIPYAEDTSGAANTVIANYTPPITGQVAGDLVLVKLNNTNTSAVMITINALAPKPIYRNDGVALQSYDLLKGECILIEYNTTYWQMLRLVRSQVYFKLNANLIIYVNTSGNDTTGDGTKPKPFKTVQRAVDYVRGSFLIAGRTVTIQLDAIGTYAGTVTITDLPGSLIIQGKANNPSGYVIQASPNRGAVEIAGSGANVTITGLTMSNVSADYHVLQCNYGATVSLSEVWFAGVQAYYHIGSTAGAIIMAGNIDFWSNAQGAIGLGNGASCTIGLWSTVITNHGNHFFTAFIYASTVSVAQITYPYCTFAGYGTGYRYAVDMNAVVLTGGGPYYLPGNIDGVTYSNGLYI